MYYGKLTLYRQLAGFTTSSDGHGSHANYQYFIQKQGQSQMLKLTNSNLINCVQDDPLALHKALAARTYATISIATAFTTAAGLACIFLKPDNNSIKQTGAALVLVSVPTSVLSHYIGHSKRFKAIVIYDR